LNPHPETKVLFGAKLFVLGTPDQIENMKGVMIAEE